jgi:hypothetical protein
MPAPGTRALIDVALDTFGLFARSNRRPVRKIADEQPPAPGFEPIIEREALAAVSPNLDAEPDHFVVLEKWEPCAPRRYGLHEAIGQPHPHGLLSLPNDAQSGWLGPGQQDALNK